jgi:DNA primase
MDQVEEVKSKTDIVQLIGEYVQLKKAGRNLKANCPFHGEKTPSFMVNPELQIFKCFGCGVGGDCFTFMQKMEGAEFGEVLKILADKAGVKLVSYKASQGEEVRERLIRINQLAADYYNFLLTKHAIGNRAMEYLQSRGLTGEVVEKFGLGYAPSGWDFLVKYLTGKKGFSLEEVVKVGLVTKTYDRFRDRVMFPLKNPRGQVVGFAGRIMPGSKEEAKYINTSETELYHKSELLYGLDVTRQEVKGLGVAVVVEGEIDAIASWQAGVKNVVAIKGSALTEKQVDTLRRYCETVVLALDADSAGDSASRRGIEMAQKKGMFVKMAGFNKDSKFKDPGEMAIERPQEWKRVIDEAIPIYDFYIHSAVSRYGVEVQGKRKIGQEILPIIGQIDDEIEKAHYIKKIAQVLGVSEEDVRKQMAKSQDFGIKAQELGGKNEGKKGRREMLEEYVMRLAVKLEKKEELREVVGLIRDGFWQKVAEELIAGVAVAKLKPELRVKVEELALDESEPEQKEWEKAVRQLMEVVVREKIQDSGSRSQEEVASLVRQLADLTRER